MKLGGSEVNTKFYCKNRNGKENLGYSRIDRTITLY